MIMRKKNMELIFIKNITGVDFKKFNNRLFITIPAGSFRILPMKCFQNVVDKFNF